MDAIGLNPIKLDAIGLDPIRMNAIRLGVPGASSGSGRPYIDPELLSHVKMAISTWGKTNDDPDRTVLKDLSGNGNDMHLLNFSFTEGSGYGLPGTDFEGWLCTDGIDDMIVSEKTVDEMIGDSKECTVISIINYISDIAASTNVFGRRYIRNSFIGNGIDGKYYICGYTSKNIDERGNVTVINDILGDKNDFSANYVAASGVADYFSVTGYLDGNNVPQRCVKIAYAGGFIANKVLTTDEINQIIAYFNLDRPGQIIKPQLYCNIKKQGITNDNHAEFNDQLIDFVGGHNIQLNNIGWEGESGINSYPVVFGANKTWINLRTNDNIKWSYELTSNRITIYKVERSTFPLFYSYIYNEGIVSNITISPFNIKVSGLKTGESIRYYYVSTDNTAIRSYINITANGVHKLPASVSIQITEESPSSIWVGMTMTLINNENIEGVTIEILPTIENALCLDGISDFGKATGLPILKDYTVVADREWLESKGGAKDGGIVSKSGSVNNGAFILEQYVDNTNNASTTWTFGKSNKVTNANYAKRELIYQSKYSYLNNDIVAGDGIDVESMWLGTIRDNSAQYSKIAIRSLMLFPYSLSEFLLERQLRKYKAGTLYPDMIEFRPVIKSNVPYLRILYFITSTGDQIIKGSYIPIGSVIQINIQTVNATDEISSVSVNGKEVDMYNKDETYWRYRFKVTKSPQKISIAIDEYIRYEDIVWPYPSMIDIYNSETDYKYTWGDILKVGSKFKFKDFGYSLLSELYETWFEIKSPNGGTLPIELNKDYEVYKGLSFVAHNTYKLDNNKPKCILSPSRLRIPNSSYKILGHIPDISGHGNHGVIRNSAYSGNSGANGEIQWTLENYIIEWLTEDGYFEANSNSIIIKEESFDLEMEVGYGIPSGEVEVSGLKEGSSIFIQSDAYNYSIVTNGRHTIPYLITDMRSGYISVYNCKGVVIKGVAEYEGAFCLDGVDDCIDIPTTLGGKQVIMKTIWQLDTKMIYDQRKENSENTDKFAIYTSAYLPSTDESVPAYRSRNNGKTYIDGILNNYLTVENLKNRLHNITITNELVNNPTITNPRIGASLYNSNYQQMALYDFMLFDEISTDEKIRELNDVIGIEGDYVEKPEYYWDAHGKTNVDPDKNTIKNRGTEQSLISNSSPTNLQTDWIANEFTFVNSASDVDIMSGDRLASTAYEARFLTSRVIPAMQVTLTLVNSAYDTFSYMYVDDAGSVQRLYFNDLVLNEPVTVDLPKNNNNNTNTGFILEANNPNAVINVKVLSQSVNIENAFDLEANNLAYTDESGYKENGLYLDGVEDYLVNPNVPALTDYTYIIKFKDFDNPVYNSCIQHKGPYKAGGSAFIQDYVDTSGLKYQYSFGSSNNVRNNDTVIYCTKKNYNGNPIGSGTNSDGLGITTGKWASYRKMIFYKEMLFSRTIDMLSINMLRNLFELDEIIDLNNKLFKK